MHFARATDSCGGATEHGSACPLPGGLIVAASWLNPVNLSADSLSGELVKTHIDDHASPRSSAARAAACGRPGALMTDLSMEMLT
jgi:hypothetical protein